MGNLLYPPAVQHPPDPITLIAMQLQLRPTFVGRASALHPNALGASPQRPAARLVVVRNSYTQYARPAANTRLSKDVLVKDPDLAEVRGYTTGCMGPPHHHDRQKVYMASRAATISKFFPGSLDVHDYVQRLDIALQAYGFDGNNSIGACTLCRQSAHHNATQQQ